MIEQHDSNFLMYIKNGFKLQEEKDTSVSFLVEIHLKPHFHNNGGNIVGLSDNSNETTTNTFAFTLKQCIFHNINMLCILC